MYKETRNFVQVESETYDCYLKVSSLITIQYTVRFSEYLVTICQLFVLCARWKKSGVFTHNAVSLNGKQTKLLGMSHTTLLQPISNRAGVFMLMHRTGERRGGEIGERGCWEREGGDPHSRAVRSTNLFFGNRQKSSKMKKEKRAIGQEREHHKWWMCVRKWEEKNKQKNTPLCQQALLSILLSSDRSLDNKLYHIRLQQTPQQEFIPLDDSPCFISTEMHFSAWRFMVDACVCFLYFYYCFFFF